MVAVRIAQLILHTLSHDSAAAERGRLRDWTTLADHGQSQCFEETLRTCSPHQNILWCLIVRVRVMKRSEIASAAGDGENLAAGNGEVWKDLR